LEHAANQHHQECSIELLTSRGSPVSPSIMKRCMKIVSILLLLGTPIGAQDEPVRGQPTLQPWMGEVKGSVVNIRTGPSMNHFAFFQLRGGTRLIALGGQGDWVEVAIPADRPVWIHGDYLKPQGDALQVSGSRVRIRATAGTKHAPLGMTEQGQSVRPTGKADSAGTWVEVYAPLNAHAWIHGDYIRRVESELNPLHLSRQHKVMSSFAGAGGGVRTGDSVKPVTEPASGDDKDVESRPAVDEEDLDPNTVKIPAFDSPRLKKLFEGFKKETEKNPVEWNFDRILEEMRVIENSTEDVGEVEVVRDLTRTIQEHFMPLHRRLVEIQRQQEKARSERELARAKENEILRKTGHRSTDPGVKYQAVGWVVPLGKHRDVEATHKLMKGNQLLYHLDGGKLNLDQYVNKRVGIVGTVEEQDPSTGARLIRIKSIEVLSQ
jgi:uncharacterized protein YraI